MTGSFRHLAPAGAPIGAADVLRWARTTVAGNSAESLGRMIQSRFGVKHCLLANTGRAGLTLLLRALSALGGPQRRDVVVPAYTCYSVAASIIKAGLRPRIVDVAPATLDYGPELHTTDFTGVLAVIATNLYGLPNAMPALSSLTRARGVFLIDDAAQAMGAAIGGRPSGAWGDAGLFSFDKGKNVSAIDGGLIVTNSDEVATVLAREFATLPAPSLIGSGAQALKALAYAVFLRPWLYAIPNAMPLGLGSTTFTTDFSLGAPDPILTSLALTMLPRLETFAQARSANAAALMQGLEPLPHVRVVRPAPDATAAHLRLPVLFDSSADRDQAVTALVAAGIGASTSYPAALLDVPEVAAAAAPGPAAPGGRFVAAHVMTLPTHPFVTVSDINRTIAVIGRHARGADAPTAAALSH